MQADAAFIDARAHNIIAQISEIAQRTKLHGNFFLVKIAFDRLLTRNIIFLCNEEVKSFFKVTKPHCL